MNSKKFTGIANGSARTDSIALGQVQDGTYGNLGASSGTDTYTAAPSPVITAYTASQRFTLEIGVDNTGAATLNISTVGAEALEKYDGAGALTALEAGDVQAGQKYDVVRNQANTKFVVLNPSITLDEDDMSSDSATHLATQQSIKAYADNIPMFKAYINSAQTIATATATKAQFDTESFDTNSWYDNATNYRYTPLKAGKYLVIARLRYNNNTVSEKILYIYKNGSSTALDRKYNATSATITNQVTSLIDMNGSTDYLEIFTEQNTGGNADTFTTTANTEFSAIYIGV